MTAVKPLERKIERLTEQMGRLTEQIEQLTEAQMRVNSTPPFASPSTPEPRPSTKRATPPATPDQENDMTVKGTATAPANTNNVEIVESTQMIAARDFLADFANAAVHGSQVGAATQLNSMLVDGVLKLFPVDGMTGMIINTNAGRQVLRIALPLGLGTVASLAPNLIPAVVDASLVRKVCLYMAEGEAAQIVRPALERMGDLLKAVVAAGVRSGIDLAGIDPKSRDEAQRWAEEADREEKQRTFMREEAEKQRVAMQQAVEAAVRAAVQTAPAPTVAPAPTAAPAHSPEALAELVRLGVLTQEEARARLGLSPAATPAAAPAAAPAAQG